MSIPIERIDRIFANAEEDGRDFLLEPEFYAVLGEIGIPVPRHIFLPSGKKISGKALGIVAKNEVVVKVVSPKIVHKSDIGGVEMARAEATEVNRICHRMMTSIPRNFLRWEKRTSKKHSGKSTAAAEMKKSIRGFLISEKIDYVNIGFGSEILCGIRNSKDFGPILTVGSGGLDVEYMKENLKEKRALTVSAVHLIDKGDIPGQFSRLAFFAKVGREFRGRKPLIQAKTLVDILWRFRELSAAYSPYTSRSPYVIEEAEVNPFVIDGGRLLPLDGLCRFSRKKVKITGRPFQEIRRLLRPQSIGIIGVSEKMNMGRIILKNILSNGFPAEKVLVVKPGLSSIDNCRCVSSVRELPHKVDLFILTLGAEQCFDVMQELVENRKAASVIIIAGGMGEKEGGENIEDSIRALLDRARHEGKAAPVVNGGNCLGIYSKPGRFDTTFIPEYKLPPSRSKASNMVFLSQSGAFLAARLNKLPGVQPLYTISLGNQLDLTVSDYLDYLETDSKAKIFAVYLEGFKPGDGLPFARAVWRLTAKAGKSVLVYKAGRSPEGRAATSSHTASVAGDYLVTRSALEQAGAIVAEDLFTFESFLRGLIALESKKIRGRRGGFISNAGFECVVLADNLTNGFGLDLADFTPSTRKKMGALLRPLGIDRLQDIHNPLDVTPVADAAAYCGCVRAILDDENVDCAVVSNVPMTPAMQTLPRGAGHREDFTRPGSFARRMIKIFQTTDKPFVVNIDSGEMYTPLASFLERAGIPVFRRADDAVRFLRLFVASRLRSIPLS